MNRKEFIEYKGIEGIRMANACDRKAHKDGHTVQDYYVAHYNWIEQTVTSIFWSFFYTGLIFVLGMVFATAKLLPLISR